MFIDKRYALVALAVVATAACTVHDTSTPSLSGPSGLGLTLRVSATPDTINQDGGSQSSIRVTAIGPNGRPLAAVPVRVDMAVGGVAQDFGTLSARTIVTGSDGTASVVFTAPPSPVNGVFGTCNGLPGNCVAVVATATSTDFTAANPESVTIRLVPPGVILPPASAPTAAFTVSPTPVNFNVSAIFDASSSLPGAGAAQIVNYAWSFGDGGTATGRIVNHTFTGSTQATTTFNVTLTVTNDRGLTGTISQQITVGPTPIPTGDFVFSPSQPLVGQSVLFDASAVRAAPGHSIVQISWVFGDGATKTGTIVTHDFGATGTFNVTMTATDEAGQKLTIAKPVQVGAGTGVPNANFTYAPGTPVAVGTTVTLDASASTAANGARVVAYTWTIAEPGGGTFTTDTPVITHTFSTAGNFTISLSVTDSAGRVSNTTSRPITVQ